jgi:2-oxoglutarate dehydrogenase E2 component (dihydrolipoamide succinyltransferase)
MPAAQRAMAQTGVKPEQVEATGPGGRILKEDVMRAADAAKAPAPAAAPAPVRDEAADVQEEEIVPMSPMRQTIARRLIEAQQNAALLTTFNEVDMTAIMSLRKQHQESFEKRYGIKLGFMSFFAKAAVDALKQFPAINAEIRGTNIVYKNHYDIGIAVSTERGLVVPIIRNVERLSFAEVEQKITDFAQRARAGKIGIQELQGGTFTITNGGIFGSLLSTPIVNPPQSGVLGMHAIQDRPVARDGQVVIRPMMYIALTYDHRVVDGREAVTFLKRIKETVEDPTRMLIEA